MKLVTGDLVLLLFSEAASSQGRMVSGDRLGFQKDNGIHLAWS